MSLFCFEDSTFILLLWPYNILRRVTKFIFYYIYITFIVIQFFKCIYFVKFSKNQVRIAQVLVEINLKIYLYTFIMQNVRCSVK